MKSVEQTLLDALSLEAPWSLIETFAELPRWRPEDVNVGGDVIAERLAALGVPVDVHRPEIFLSIPISASVEAAGETHRAKPPSMSVSVPGGLSGDLVYLGADLKNLRSYSKDVRELFGDSFTSWDEVRSRIAGRILVTEGFGNPALTQLAEEWGAVGLISVNPGIDIHWGTCTTIWGTPDLDDLPRKPKIPVVSVNNPSGQALIALAREGGSATIRTEMQEGWYPQAIPTVHIPGASEPERFVFVHGHYDSWDVGIGDNATGDATLLELARVLWHNRQSLRRSVRIAWWPGHSTGRYAGSTWYADAFALDLDENCVAQINCDSPGCRWATSYHQTTCMPEMQPFVTQVIEEVTGTAPQFKRPNQAGDYSFNNIGLSSYYMLSSTMPNDVRAEKGYYDVSGCGGNIAWHTENDTIEIADRDVLMTDMKIYLLSVLRHANAPVLPADWTRATREYRATIAGYQEAAGDRFDLDPAQRATTALEEALDRLYAGIDGGTVDEAAANTVQMALSRILVPLHFTAGPRFTHDPAYTAPPLPVLYPATALPEHGPDTIGFAKTQLMRGLNRYVAAVNDARRLVEWAAR